MSGLPYTHFSSSTSVLVVCALLARGMAFKSFFAGYHRHIATHIIDMHLKLLLFARTSGAMELLAFQGGRYN